MNRPLFLALAASALVADDMRALGFKEESITARRQREAAEVRRMMRRQQKPYKGKIGAPQPDNREDKYLHSAARRRRQAERSLADGAGI